jgi:hypothetical protein
MGGTLDLSPFEAAKRMAALSPETLAVFEDRMSCGWDGAEQVIQGFDAIGTAIASNRRPVSDANKKKLFDFAEELLCHGAGGVSNAVATRMLERVWSAAHGSGFDFSSVDEFLGPQSRAYIAALDDFHKMRTDGLRRK